MVTWLVVHGANRAARDGRGLTPLELARRVQPGGWWARVWEPGMGRRLLPNPAGRAATVAALEAVRGSR